MSSLLLPLLFSAMADGPGEVLQARLASAGEAPPPMGVACQPASTLFEWLEEFIGDNPVFSQLVMQVGQGDSLLQFLEADRRTALGLDESGPLHMLAWDEAVEVGVPFSGTEAQAELLSSLWEGPGIVSERSENLLFWRQGTRDPLMEVPQSLFAGLEGVGGCMGYSLVPAGFRPDPAPFMGAMLIHGGEGPGLFFRFAPTPSAFSLPLTALAESLAISREAPENARTDRMPMAVISAGLDLQDYLKLIEVTATFQGRDMPEPLEGFGGQLDIPGGIVLALFEDDQEAISLAGVIPIRKPNGRTFAPGVLNRRLMTLLEDEFNSCEKTSRKSLSCHDDPAESEGRPLWAGEPLPNQVHVLVERGRILLATEDSLLAEMVAGTGEPWLDSEELAEAEEWPLMLVARPEHMRGWSGLWIASISGRLGLRGHGGMLDLGLWMTVPSEVWVAAISGATSNFVTMGMRARRAEVPAGVSALAVAEQAFHASTGCFQSVPEEGEEERAEAWESLGFNPLETEFIRGHYWVESEDCGSITVYGTIDADGDGLPARYRWSVEGDVELQTPLDVY